MKILMATAHAGHGGDWVVLESLARRLLRDGHEVTVASGNVPRSADLPGARFLTVPLNRGWRGLLRAAASLRRAGERYDVVHPHNPAAALYGTLLARLRGGKVVYSCHWHPPESGPRRAAKRLLFRRFDLVHCTSEESAGEVRRAYRVPARRVAVVYNGVEAGQFAPGPAGERRDLRARHGVPADAFVLCFVGRLNPEKNLPMVLRYLHTRAGSHPDLHLAVAGEGPCRRAWEGEAGRLGLGGRVRFLGYVRPTRSVYVMSDLCVLPSEHETFGLTCVEAFLCGVPVFRSDAFGCSAQIVPGRTGDRHRVNDQGDFDRKLDALLADRGKLPGMGAEGRRLALDRFTLDRTYEGILGLYARAVSEA